MILTEAAASTACRRYYCTKPVLFLVDTVVIVQQKFVSFHSNVTEE